MKVLAFDPGVHTGWCLLEGNSKEIQVIKAGVVKGFDPMCQKIWWTMGAGPDVVICETFKLFLSMGTQAVANDPDLNASQLQGVIRYLAKEKLVMQQPSMKNGVPDEELKKLGFWRLKEAEIITDSENPGSLYKHMHDAMRHAVYYIWRNEK